MDTDGNGVLDREEWGAHQRATVHHTPSATVCLQVIQGMLFENTQKPHDITGAHHPNAIVHLNSTYLQL